MIENFTGDNGYEDLIEEVRKQGMTCHVLDITNHFELKPQLMPQEDEVVIFQGSIQMFRKLRNETKLKPLGWMTEENYLCSKYYPVFQQYLFNDKYVLVPLAALKAHKFFFYGIFGKDTMIYIRPDRGDKPFTGQLVDLQDFDRLWKNDIVSTATDSDLVLVSTPKNIVGEWRFIVTDQKEIVAVSTYLYQGNRTHVPSAPEEAFKLVRTLLEVGYYPDPVFTIDICEDSDHNYWMLEINSFTSAGTYAAKKEPIIRRVSEIASNQISST